jgi:2-keto-4-pentenoate hydratase/2-oxohepta-3-ene-1,7-dioic acid hydratase in catechol pathway
VRLVSYLEGGAVRSGIVREGDVFDLGAVLRVVGLDPVTESLTVHDAVAQFGDRLQAISAILGRALPDAGIEAVARVDDLDLLPPIVEPSKVICVGLNYAEHVLETGRQLPTFPDLFAKFATTLVGASAPISGCEISDNLDFEGELAIVIGKRAHRVSEADALDFVAGVSVLDDISARDLQYRGTQWLAGKTVDRSTPMGPALVTLDEIDDLQALDIETRVNGVVMQSSNTRHMIFPIARIVAYISSFLELSPGDVIATGTPDGIGAKRNPPIWLQPGDVVEVEIPGVGSVKNRVA